jgi:hypothetical protein
MVSSKDPLFLKAQLGLERSLARITYKKVKLQKEEALSSKRDSIKLLDKPLGIYYSNELEELKTYPIYSGCEETGTEPKSCMQQYIARLIGMKFRTELGQRLDLYGRFKIIAGFTVNRQGKVVDITAKAVHPALEKEAIRLMQLIPDIQPGTNLNGEPVEVTYEQPITFIIE